MTDDSESYNKLKEARLRLEGGGKLSEAEHYLIDTLNARFALAIYQTKGTSVSLAVQSLSEMLLSAMANNAKNPEEFYRNVYNFAKDFLFPQADKIKEVILQRRDELKEIASKNPGQIKKNMENKTRQEFLNELNQMLAPNDCNCDICTERRSKQNTVQINEPKSPTKH